MSDEHAFYKLLPQHVRGGDPDLVLQAVCDGVQAEHDRLRSEIMGLEVLSDIDRVNQDYFFVGSPPSALTDTKQIKFPNTASDLDGYYVGKWVRIFGGTGGIPTRTRRVVAYDGATRIATLDRSWGTAQLQVVDEYLTRIGGVVDTDPFVSTFAHGSITPGSVVVHWGGAPPIYTPLLTAVDDGTGGIFGYDFAGTIDYETGDASFDRTLYGDIADVSVRVNYAYDGDVLPDTTSVFGLLHVYVGLEYPARTVGFVPAAGDPDQLVREQIKNSIDVSKLRGTERGFELLLRTLGFDASIVELKQNYVHAPEDEPGVPDPDYRTYRVQAGPVYVPREGGEDEASAFLAANPSATVGSSDIEVYVSRRHPDIVVGATLFARLRAQLDVIRPIHVEIALIGLVETAIENLLVADSLEVDLSIVVDEALSVADALTIIVGGSLRIDEALSVADELTIVGTARWDRVDRRWDRSRTRYDVGTIFFRG